MAEAEAMKGAGAAVAADDQPPLVAGGGVVAEAEAMEVVAGPRAGAGRHPSTTALEKEKFLAVGVFFQHLISYVGRSRRVNHVAHISAMLKAMFRDDQRGRLLRHVFEHDATEATRQHRIAAGKKSPTHTAGKRKKYTCHLI